MVRDQDKKLFLTWPFATMMTSPCINVASSKRGDNLCPIQIIPVNGQKCRPFLSNIPATELPNGSDAKMVVSPFLKVLPERMVTKVDRFINIVKLVIKNIISQPTIKVG